MSALPAPCPACSGTGVCEPDKVATGCVSVVAHLVVEVFTGLLIGGLAARYGASGWEAVGAGGLVAVVVVPVVSRIRRKIFGGVKS